MEASFNLTKKIASLLDDGNETNDHLEIFINLFLSLGIIILVIICLIILFIPILILLLIDYIYGKIVKIKVDEISKTKVKNIVNSYYNEIIPKNRYYYLQGYKHQNISLERFIHKFISVYNDIYPTYEVGDNYYICDTGRRRSAHDIYLICKNYYEGITIDDVLTILVNLRNDNIIKGSYCTNICIYVYHNTSNHRNDNDNTEYGNGIKFKDLINAYKE
jgi:hypothetical protein